MQRSLAVAYCTPVHSYIVIFLMGLCHLTGLLVDDATDAYNVSVANGAKGVRPPTRLDDGGGGAAVVSEVLVYGDVVLRYISGKWQVRRGHIVTHL